MSSATDRYKVLLEIGHVLTSARGRETLHHALHQQIRRVLPAHSLAVLDYDPVIEQAEFVFRTEGEVIQPAGQVVKAIDIPALRERGPSTLPGIPLLGSPPPGTPTLSVPITSAGEILGAICILGVVGQPFTPEDIETLAIIGDMAGITLGNIRHLEENERRRREAERLEEIGRALTASLDLPRVLERVVAAARDLTESDSASVWLLRGRNEVEVAMTAGKSAPPRGLRFPVPAEVRQQALSGQPFVFEDVAQADLLPDYLREASGSMSIMAVALFAEDQMLGALSVGQTAHRRYRSEEIRLLERLGFQAAIAVANARLHERIFSLSLTDPLTGLPNRRHLEIFLEKEFAAAKRGRQLTLLLFDLDNFKEFNDRAGHQAGDEALCAFASVLANQTRAMNLAARYGGDEFVSILADTDRRGGLTHAARIAREVKADPLLGANGIRASVGVASYSARITTPADLIRAADRDLYARKSGRSAGSHAVGPTEIDGTSTVQVD